MPVPANVAPADTRERILAATWKLMEESRDLQVRIADIAAAAGVSRQAVYLHFGNRPNLLLAAVQYRDQTSPTAAIGTAAENDAVPGALARFVEAWFGTSRGSSRSRSCWRRRPRSMRKRRSHGMTAWRCCGA